MTERLYYTDPALIEFEGTITRATEGDRGWEVCLDQSAFYPTSGGQQADRGVLGGATVMDVFEDEAGSVVHLVSVSPGEVGMRVRGHIDAGRRKRHRQQHTAQHILSQVFIRLFSLETVSVHLGDEYGGIELAGELLSVEDLAAADFEANRIVGDNLPVRIRFVAPDQAAQLPLRRIPGREGEIRVIQIGEFDYSACGGTHCLSTAEVGLIKITGVTRQRGNALVTFLAGEQAYKDYVGRFRVTEEVARTLTCHYADIPDRLAKLSEDIKQYKLQVGAAQRELLPLRIEQLAGSAEQIGAATVVTPVLEGYESKAATMLLSALAARIKGVAASVVENRLIVATDLSSGHNAGELVKRLAAETGLRGGGSPQAAQLGGVTSERVAECTALLRRMLADG